MIFSKETLSFFLTRPEYFQCKIKRELRNWFWTKGDFWKNFHSDVSYTPNLKDVSATIPVLPWAERLGIRALQSARKVNWSRCFSPGRWTIADCPYGRRARIRGILLWGLAGGGWRPCTYHRDRILEDRGVEMPREYSFSSDGMKSRGVQRIIHAYRARRGLVKSINSVECMPSYARFYGY